MKASLPKPTIVFQCELGNFQHALTNNRCRKCGRYACDDCCDLRTSLCMCCVPVDEEEYANECLVQLIVDTVEGRLEAFNVN